jgi:hypothetical protein
MPRRRACWSNGAGGDEVTDKPALEILALVEAALSDTEGKKPRQIYAAINIGSLRMIHTCLRWLCREGHARYEGPERARIYFRTARAEVEQPK